MKRHLRQGIIVVFSAFRQRLLDKRKEARLAISGVKEIHGDAHKANHRIFRVELKNEEAILSSSTGLQQRGALWMPVPYREGCAYTFANGKLSLLF